ncbi:twin-arginine translocase subunit TatB, partial [cyanobacterium TDX16]
MFNVGGAELFVILLLALVVLGPDKLPGAMRTVGQWAGEMRKMANGFQAEMNKAIADPLDTKGAEKSTEAKAGDVVP